MEYAEIARAETDRGELVLRRISDERAPSTIELRANGVFVMDTFETVTEQALAGRALDQVADPRDVLIGGLGLGFTLQRVLADPRVEKVAVVEIEEALIRWMRDGTVPHGPEILADQRVRIVNADIAMAVAEASSRFDLVLLDVDNGPGYLVHDANAELYEEDFLAACRRLLNPDGVLVVWSASPSPALAESLTTVFGSVDEIALPVDLQGRDEHYYLYRAPAGDLTPA